MSANKRFVLFLLSCIIMWWWEHYM